MSVFKYLRPSNYWKYLCRHISRYSYDLESIHAIELEKFADAGLNYDEGLKRLNKKLQEIDGKQFNHTTGTDSIHWLLFSCFSISERAKKIHRILEIGTFRGKSTSLLTKLFPEAQITTCDLPESDPILTASYRRETAQKLNEYIQKRNSRLEHSNITFVEKNSFFLPSVVEKGFDLVWLDGGHMFPEVAWDLCNAWNLSNPGAIIMCDDVYTHPKGGDNIYGNADAFNILNYLQHRTKIDVRYFLKRENPDWSSDERDRKYVATFIKP